MEIALAILTAIAAFPKIFAFFEKAIVASAAALREIKVNQYGKKLDKATAKVKKKKDQRDLEKLLRG